MHKIKQNKITQQTKHQTVIKTETNKNKQKHFLEQ